MILATLAAMKRSRGLGLRLCLYVPCFFSFARSLTIIDDNLTLRDYNRKLYLNEGMKGGETSFPRWVNAETFRELKVVPVIGKAVLFYSQLPDGNFDDFSQHAALPVTEGEKVLHYKTDLACKALCPGLTLVSFSLRGCSFSFLNSGYVCHVSLCIFRFLLQKLTELSTFSLLQLINLWVWADEYR